MPRLSKDEILIKLEVLEKVALILKEKSTPKKNLFTLNMLLKYANEELALLEESSISPTSLKGNKPSPYFKKFQDDVNNFDTYIKTAKEFAVDGQFKRIEDLEKQNKELMIKLVEYESKAQALSKALDDQMEINRELRKDRDNNHNQTV
jgi:hypothetical protein